MKTKSVLPWFGSDASVASQLGNMLDRCRHVTIPFCGGMSILPHLKAKGIVANDAHEHAINFYRVASMDNSWSEMLAKFCEKTLSHPAELRLAEELTSVVVGPDKIVQAWAFWALCWIGRKGKGGTKHQGGKPSVRRTASGGNNASRIQSAAADLREWAEEFKRCEWTCEDFRDCIDKVADRPDCGIYADPPWFGAGRNYLHNFTAQDHIDLRDKLNDHKDGPQIVVRYGDCNEVRDLYSDWHITEAVSRTQANKKLGELWITNFEVSA